LKHPILMCKPLKIVTYSVVTRVQIKLRE